MQLKVKFIIAFDSFTPNEIEITPSGYQHVQPKRIFWFLHGIKKQTISDWAKDVHDYVCEGVPYHGDSQKTFGNWPMRFGVLFLSNLVKKAHITL